MKAYIMTLLYLIALSPLFYLFYRFTLIKINFNARFEPLIFISRVLASSPPRLSVITIVVAVTLLTPLYYWYDYILHSWYYRCLVPLNILGTYDLVIYFAELIHANRLNPYFFDIENQSSINTFYGRQMRRFFGWGLKIPFLMTTKVVVPLARSSKNSELHSIFNTHDEFLEFIKSCPKSYVYDDLTKSDFSWFRYQTPYPLPDDIFCNIDTVSYVIFCYLGFFFIVGIILFILFDSLRMLLKSLYHYVVIVADLLYVLGSVCLYFLLFTCMHLSWFPPTSPVFINLIVFFLGFWFLLFKIPLTLEAINKYEKSLLPEPTEQEKLMTILIVQVILPASRALRESWFNTGVLKRRAPIQPKNAITVHEITCLEDLTTRAFQEIFLFWECLNNQPIWYFKARYLGIQPIPEGAMEIEESLFIMKYSDLFLLLIIIICSNHLREQELRRKFMYKEPPRVKKISPIAIFFGVNIVLNLIITICVYISNKY